MERPSGPTGVSTTTARSPRAIGGGFAPALAGRQVDVEQMDLVVAGADLARRRRSRSRDWRACRPRACSASEPRWTQMPGSRRRLAHRGEHRIVGLRVEMRGRARPVAVEQAAHLGREQHRRAARRRLARRARDERPRHWLPGRSRSAPGRARSSCRRASDRACPRRSSACEVVRAADMAAVDEDLRHAWCGRSTRCSISARFGPPRRDVIFLDSRRPSASSSPWRAAQ